jgi:very-short-patch-repair endonuclease
MPDDSGLDRKALAAWLRAQDNLISREQALACGLTRSALAHRVRPDGPWRRLLCGIYLAQTGPPSVPQQEMAALLHAGPGSVLTGAAALRGLGLSTAESGHFDVLVPAARKPRSTAFVTIRRTTRMPQRVIREDRRCYALPPRALADAARFMADLGEVRALIAGAVQRRDCTLQALVRELREGQTQNSARLRQVLAEAAAGVRSAAEGDFMDLIKRARLPVPMFNARLLGADGRFIAVVDACWPEAAVAAEVDSREWHLNPADWERTIRRHARISSHGILVLHFTPRQIRTDPAGVAGTIADTLRAGQARPRPLVSARLAA